MRVAWKETDGVWRAHVGPCWITLRPMDWYHPQAREHRDAIDRTWIYSVRHYTQKLVGSDLTEGVFEVDRAPREGGELLDTLRESYAAWRDNARRYGRGVYPEPRWSTARLAGEAAQYSRPDDLDVSGKRFYALVHAALGRLKRRKDVVATLGLDDRGRETTLWEPAA